jgi:hypothetical protein
MDLSRRSFLLGAAAALAAASLPVALAPAEAASALTLGELDSRFAYRWIIRLMFCAGGEAPLRNGHRVPIHLDIHVRENLLTRALIIPGQIWHWDVDAGIILPPKEVLRFVVHPAVSHGSLGLEYGIEDGDYRPMELFREHFVWSDDQKMAGRLIALPTIGTKALHARS